MRSIGAMRERLVVQTPTSTDDGRGGRVTTWRTLDTVPAEMIPVKAWETLQAAALKIGRAYRFRIRVRADVTTTMRVLWTPSWPPGAVRQVLEISGVVPDDDGRTYMFLECAQTSAAVSA
jgi:SPP1 family predicted phage head-tail adaptor